MLTHSDSAPLRALFPREGGQITVAEWEGRLRPEMQARWRGLLGHPSFSTDCYDPAPQLLEEFHGPDFRAVAYRQPTGPGQAQRVILLHPLRPAGEPAPCAVVPFYHPEQTAGFEPLSEGGGLCLNGNDSWEVEARQIGRHLARMGMAVACVEAFPFNAVPDPCSKAPFAWWECAAAKLLRDEPGWTGLGKLVHDASRAVDLLLSQPGVDPRRLLLMGHSLGGKIALYTGALDERVSCVIGSDFGLPWHSTNWDAPWYLGERLSSMAPGMAHHELLALLAPRPFFLIAGETDTQEGWQYLDAAREVYRLYDSNVVIDGINHASGHTPNVAAFETAYAWLGKIFDLPHRHWRA